MNPKEDVHIGSFKIFLQSLAYNVELVEQLDIIDYKSEQIGMCNVSSYLILTLPIIEPEVYTYSSTF